MAKQLTVGLVDDDPDLLWVLDAMLAGHNCRTELYTSAEQFLDTAPASAAACLVVDINLGDLSGIELARQLVARGFTFPLIFMSGGKDEIVLREAAELGCIGFLEKPFSAGDLIGAVAKATGRSFKPANADQRSM